VEEGIKKAAGKIIVKSYPTKSASVLTFKNHIQKLKLKDIIPDVILVDYGDLMRSKKEYRDKRFELESVFEDLRSLAMELNVPIWTATQTNRDGIDVEIVTLKYVGESFAKCQISDLIITLNREKTGGVITFGNMHVGKSRLGPDGVTFPVSVNTSLSRIEVIPGELHEASENGDNRLRQRVSDLIKNNQSTATVNNNN
jgi:hypothetical protein